MSFSVRLAYTRRTSVRSRTLPSTSCSTWYMGVMPVPAATMPTASHMFAS